MKSKFVTAFADYVDTLLHFVLLNFVFLVSCIPIITIGPALASLYQVTMREARNEHGYLVRYYWKCFKEMLIQGMVTFLFLGAIIMAFLFSAAFWLRADYEFAVVALVLCYIGLLLATITFIYAFPLMARFSNTIWQTIKNAFLIGLSNGKFTFAMVVLHLFEISLVYLFAPVRVFMIVVGFAFFGYFNAILFGRFLVKFEE